MSDAATSFPVPPPMRNGRSHGMPVFLLALLIGGGLHLALLILFHFKIGPPATGTARPPAPHIHFNPDSPALRVLLAQAQFSPEQTYPASEKSFSAQAQSIAPTPAYPAFESFTTTPAPTEVDFNQPDAVPKAAGPGDALKPTDWGLLGSIGQAPTPVAKLAPRGAFVRITRLQAMGQSGKTVVEVEWPADLALPTGNWQPVSFLLSFNASGLAGEPVLEPGLGTLSQDSTPNEADVNKILREKLRDWFTKHPPLPAGLYEAVVGP